MSLLLALFSIGIGASMVKEVAKDATKVPARSRIQENCKNGSFDVISDFEDILHVCDVRRKKFGNSSVAVLPYTGYEKCLKYVREHHMTCGADEQRFVNHYRKVLKRELSERQAEWDKHYAEIESQVKSMIATDGFEVVRFTHFDTFVEYADVEMKVNDICNNTFLGDLVIGEVKIRQETSHSHTEIWGLKVPLSMKFDLKRYYEACAQKCGYIY